MLTMCPHFSSFMLHLLGYCCLANSILHYHGEHRTRMGRPVNYRTEARSGRRQQFRVVHHLAVRTMPSYLYSLLECSLQSSNLMANSGIHS